SDLFSGHKAVEATTRAEIDHPFAWVQCALRERITDTRKRFDGALRRSGDNVIVVAQSPRQRSSGMEVEGAVRIDGDIPILGPDFIAEAHRIDRQSFTHPVLLLGG